MLKEHIRNILARGFSQEELKSWYDPLVLYFDGDKRELSVNFPHRLFGPWFAQKGKISFEQAVLSHFGTAVSIKYINSHPKANRNQSNDFFYTQKDNNINKLNTSTLKPSLDSFICNKKNSFPLETAREIAGKSGAIKYNPFILYGKIGNGKTHVLRGMATAMGESREQIFCGSVEDLEKKFDWKNIEKSGGSLQAVLLDDLQRVAGRADLQDNLVRIFDLCLDRGIQMVFAFSGTLKDIKDISEDLRSRLESGLLAELKSPDFDVRLRYARHHCLLRGIELAKEHMITLAQRCHTIRHLSGIILKLAAFSELVKREVSAEDLQNILHSSSEKSYTDPKDILAMVAGRTGLSTSEIMADNRKPAIVRARQIAMLLCREQIGMSYPAIGRFFGGKDHSTVMHSIRKIKEIMVGNKEVKDIVTNLERMFLTGE